VNARSPSSIVKRLHILGSVVGVICGCSLGLVNLLLIDASEAKEFKLSAAGSDGSDFSVAITNQERDDCTAVIIEGPATKGLEGVRDGMTAWLRPLGCRKVGRSAQWRPRVKPCARSGFGHPRAAGAPNTVGQAGADNDRGPRGPDLSRGAALFCGFAGVPVCHL